MPIRQTPVCPSAPLLSDSRELFVRAGVYRSGSYFHLGSFRPSSCYRDALAPIQKILALHRRDRIPLRRICILDGPRHLSRLYRQQIRCRGLPSEFRRHLRSSRVVSPQDRPVDDPRRRRRLAHPSFLAAAPSSARQISPHPPAFTRAPTQPLLRSRLILPSSCFTYVLLWDPSRSALPFFHSVELVDHQEPEGRREPSILQQSGRRSRWLHANLVQSHHAFYRHLLR